MASLTRNFCNKFQDHADRIPAGNRHDPLSLITFDYRLGPGVRDSERPRALNFELSLLPSKP